MPGEDGAPKAPTPPQINVPDLPPADPDSDSFLEDVLGGEIISPAELTARLEAREGYARGANGKVAVFF